MHCELKNVKIAEFLSEETVAFTASLYIDGKRAADVRKVNYSQGSFSTTASPSTTSGAGSVARVAASKA